MIKLEKKDLPTSIKKEWKDFKKKCEHVLFQTMRILIILAVAFLLWNSNAFDKLKVPTWSDFSYLCHVAKTTFFKEY